MTAHDPKLSRRSLLAGANGLISVGSNALPGTFRTLCDLARAGDHDATEAWDARLQPYHDFCGVEPNPIPVKALLQRMGYGAGLRLPLLPLSTAHVAEADRLHVAALALEQQSGHETVAA